MLPLLTVAAALATSSGDSVEPLLALPPACGRVQYSGGRLGWSAHRQQQGVFASPLALGPCFGAAGGGWRCAVDETLARASNGSRQVQSVDADDLVALRAFETTHRNREPLVIRSTKRSHAWLGKGKKARAKRQKFGRDALIKTAGGQEAKAGLSHDIVIFRGEGYVRFNVAEYLEEFMPTGARHDTMQGEPFYLFQRARAAGEGEAMEWVGSLASMLVPPEATGLFETPLNMRKNSAIWLIGPPRSGTAFHSHNEAWTALAHGRKRWLFYPPEVSPPGGGSGPNFYPSFAITDWLDQVLPLLPPEQRPIEAIQNAGDLMYVPEGWSHAVLNIDDTVAVSFQSSSPAAGGPYEQISKRVGHAEADGSLAEVRQARAQIHPASGTTAALACMLLSTYTVPLRWSQPAFPNPPWSRALINCVAVAAAGCRGSRLLPWSRAETTCATW